MIDKRMTYSTLVVGLFILLVAGIASAQVSLTFVAPTNTNINLTGATQFLNITASDISTGNENVTNTTWYYSTDDSLTWTFFFSHNVSEDDNVSALNITFDTTGLAIADSSNIDINITVVGFDGTTNSTTIEGLQLDNTVPNSTVAATDNNDDSLTSKFDYGTDVNIDCDAGDLTTGVLTSGSYVSVKFPGINSYENLSLTKNTATSLKAVLKGVKTEKLGTYSIRCHTQDVLGFSNTSELNLTAQEVVLKGTSAAAIPGFEPPVAKTSIGSGTVADGGRLTTDGISRLMKVNAGLRMDINGEKHTVEVDTLSDDSVTLTVSSEPFDVTINAGESEVVDVNGDGVGDVKVTYHKLFAKTYADLTFELVSEPVTDTGSDDSSDDAAVFDDSEPEVVPQSQGGLTVTLAVIVIILIIGYALIKGKKK